MDDRLMKAPCGFISLDQNGYIIEANDRFLRWSEYKKEDVIGKHVETFLTKVNQMIFHSYFYPTIRLHGHVEEFFIHFRNKAGESVPFVMNASRLIQNDYEIIDCILVQMKKRIDYELELRVTKKQMEEAYLEKQIAFAELEQIYLEIEKKQLELLQINAELVILSDTDKLTNIPNRRFLQNALEEQIELYRKEGKQFSLLLLDIDYFKNINDTYGHPIGDQVLVKLSTILKDTMRTGDIVARFGGEEFAMILPNTDVDETIIIARAINQEVETRDWAEIGRLTVSIGGATFMDTDTEETIIKHADQALYYSKEHGRNRATHFGEMYQSTTEIDK